MDTIDVEKQAGLIKTSVVSFFTDLIWGSLVAGAPWVASAILGPTVRWVIEKGVTLAATKGGLIAFIYNTGVFTSDQAKDYRAAINELDQLPEGVSDEDWDKAELKANHSFGAMWNFTK